MPLRFKDIKAGDVLISDGDFTCLSKGQRCEVLLSAPAGK